MEQEKHWLLRSSQDPAQFGHTLRGIVMLLAVPSVLHLVNEFLGLTVLPADIEVLADHLALLGTQLSIIAGSVWAAYGVVMKVIAWINDKLVRRA